MDTVTQKITSGYKQTEIGVIPADWDVKKLGDVGEIKMCRRIFNHETREVGTIPFYKIGTFGKDADAYIPQGLYNDYRHRFSFPKKGDILISAAGTIGRTIIYDGKPAYFQDSNIIWIDNNEELISNSFLYYVFQIAKYQTEGGTIQRLYNNILNNTKFVCPLKPDQNSIVSVLSDTDALISKFEKLIEKKKNNRQGAMQVLLTGKRRLTGFSGKWEVKKLGEIVDYKNGKSLESRIKDNGDYFLITLNSLDIKGKLKSDHLRVGVNDNSLSNGDLVMILSDVAHGNFLGLTDVIPEDNKYVLNQRVGALKNIKNVLPYYLSRYINLKQKYFKTAGQGSSQQNLAKDDILNFEVNFPELEEQKAIVNVLSDMDTEIEKLESQLTKYQNIKQGMMQTLLTGKIRLLTK